jgi:hypothetical protein
MGPSGAGAQGAAWDLACSTGAGPATAKTLGTRSAMRPVAEGGGPLGDERLDGAVGTPLGRLAAGGRVGWGRWRGMEYWTCGEAADLLGVGGEGGDKEDGTGPSGAGGCGTWRAALGPGQRR